MTDEQLTELQAEVHGIRLVLGMVLNGMSDLERSGLKERLALIEADARKQNFLAGTIEVLKEYRAVLEE